MKTVATLDQEEFEKFEKNFICPAEQIWLERGIERGMDLGIERGTINTTKKIAKKMLNKTGMSIAEIAEITGISFEKLEKLKENTH